MMIVTKVIIFRTLDSCQHSCNLDIILETLSSSPLSSHSFKCSFTIPIFISLQHQLWNLKKRERENHVAIIFYGIHNDTRKYVNTRRKRCKESFSNERSSRHRNESTKHGHKNSRDTFADTSLDTKSCFHPTNSWIKVELRVTRMEKKRCHNGRHLFLAFHPKTTRHVSPSSSLIATSLATKVALIHTHTRTHTGSRSLFR